MKILKLKLENFQGLASFELDPEGKQVSVFGDNGTGKTTIYNAFCWLMYGRPGTGEKNYTPQTTGTHSLNHTAEMVLDVNGSVITIKKDYHEVYKTRRGDVNKAFAGYTTDYFIDGVPVREKDYQTRLSALIKSEDVAKLLTRYNYFLEELGIDDRRKILLEVCGDVNDAEILNDAALEGFTEMIGTHTVDEFLKIIAARKKKIDEELKQIPQRIDEAERSKPEVSGTKENLHQAIDQADAERAGLEKKKAAISSEGEADLRRQIAEVRIEMEEAKLAHTKEYAAANEDKNNLIQALEKKIKDSKNETATLEYDLMMDNNRIKAMSEERERLINKWQEVNSENWNGAVCPTCGQPLPEDQLKEKEKDFNLKKSQRLEKINEQGKAVSEEAIARIKTKAEGTQKLLEDLKKTISDCEAEKEKLSATIQPAPEFDESGYQKRIADLNARILALKVGTEQEEARFDEMIKAANKAASEAREALAGFDLIERQDKRIAELKERQKELGAEFEELEHSAYLCELYSRKRAGLMDAKVNGCFKTLRFRLFREQVNGGLADDCEALIPCDGVMVPFKSANNAARINAGLEAMDVLAGHYGLSMPTFIDNAESCTTIRSTQTQQIRLYVSEKDKKLRAVYG